MNGKNTFTGKIFKKLAGKDQNFDVIQKKFLDLRKKLLRFIKLVKKLIGIIKNSVLNELQSWKK
ncbi:MAG: hypothetical protein PVF28_04810 [Thioalkalispiraceae bacterium]|jgi:hypothetical protein